MKSTVYLVTGGFDPLHPGHIESLSIGSNVCVGLNSDMWLQRKKGYYLLPYDVRKATLEAIQTVSRVEPMDDADGTAVKFLEWARSFYGLERPLVFVNGGDRRSIKDIPKAEREALDKLLIFPRFLQTGKAYSSSQLVEDFLRRYEFDHGKN